MQLLIILSRDCKFKNVEAAVYRNECIHNPTYIRTYFNTIKQHLLENTSTKLQVIFNQARALEMVQKSSKSY